MDPSHAERLPPDHAWSVLERFCSGPRGGRIPPSTVVLAAEPGDEVAATGGRLVQLPDVTIVALTSGTPRDPGPDAVGQARSREEVARTRRRELTTALGLAGLGPDHAVVLGGIAHEACWRLAWFARSVARLVTDRRAELLVAPPYRGKGDDPDAAAFVAWAACTLAARGGRRPTAAEMGVEPAPDACEVALGPREREQKRRMMSCFASRGSAWVQEWSREERFRLAPTYRFRAARTEAPADWAHCVEEALRELDLEGSEEAEDQALGRTSGRASTTGGAPKTSS